MKPNRPILSLAVALTLLAPCVLPAARADDPPKDPAAQAADEAKAKRDLYEKFRTNLTTDSKTAYAAGKEYLTRYSKDDDEIARYVKKWVADYERLEKKNRQAELVRDPKTAGEAFAIGKELLASDPEDLATQINTAWAGFLAVTSGNEKLTGEASELSKQVIAKIEAGKTPVSGQPFAQKDETLGWLHYALGYYARTTNPVEAAGELRRAVGYEGFIKKDPQVYALLGYAYQTGEYVPLAVDFDKRYVGKPQTPESKAAQEQLYAVADRVVDAYARAVAVANASKEPARYAAQKTQWMAALTEFYKYRNAGKTDGLDALIAGVLAKPLPVPPAPPAAK